MISKSVTAALCGAVLVAACAKPDRPQHWSADEHRAFIGVEADDPWCSHMRDLRLHLHDLADKPADEARKAALAEVRAEAAEHYGGDVYWPLRKAMACEYIAGAEEEIAEVDWAAGHELLAHALLAVENGSPENGLGTIVGVYDHRDGEPAVSLEPVDLSNNDYCDRLEHSELALSQHRGDLVEDLSFPGSIRRAPDWFAHSHVSYHRWALEHLEGHQLHQGDAEFGGIPHHCQRFHAAYEGAKGFAVKDNLIFLLAELDDPNKAGRLEVEDAGGNRVVLDKVLSAAQLEPGGQGGKEVDFFPEDLAASKALANVVSRANGLPPPKVFRIFFDYNERSPSPSPDNEIDELVAELEARNPDDVLRVAISGHADCVGPRWYNTLLAEDRLNSVLDGIVRATLRKAGFAEEAVMNERMIKATNQGESTPALAREDGAKCVSLDEDRRVVVVVQ